MLAPRVVLIDALEVLHDFRCDGEAKTNIGVITHTVGPAMIEGINFYPKSKAAAVGASIAPKHS